MLTMMWRIWITRVFWVEMWNGTGALENSLAVSYKTQ